jgi:hypothetical protein
MLMLALALGANETVTMIDVKMRNKTIIDLTVFNDTIKHSPSWPIIEDVNSLITESILNFTFYPRALCLIFVF